MSNKLPIDLTLPYHLILLSSIPGSGFPIFSTSDLRLLLDELSTHDSTIPILPVYKTGRVLSELLNDKGDSIVLTNSQLRFHLLTRRIEDYLISLNTGYDITNPLLGIILGELMGRTEGDMDIADLMSISEEYMEFLKDNLEDYIRLSESSENNNEQ